MKSRDRGIARHGTAAGKAFEARFVKPAQRIDAKTAARGIVGERQKIKRAQPRRADMRGGRKDGRNKHAAKTVSRGAVNLGAAMGCGERSTTQGAR